MPQVGSENEVFLPLKSRKNGSPKIMEKTVDFVTNLSTVGYVADKNLSVSYQNHRRDYAVKSGTSHLFG
jgi:hypothetical protein